MFLWKNTVYTRALACVHCDRIQYVYTRLHVLLWLQCMVLDCDMSMLQYMCVTKCIYFFFSSFCLSSRQSRAPLAHIGKLTNMYAGTRTKVIIPQTATDCEEFDILIGVLQGYALACEWQYWTLTPALQKSLATVRTPVWGLPRVSEKMARGWSITATDTGTSQQGRKAQAS